MKDTLGFAVVGTGVMGRNHARLYREMVGANLVAVADIDERQGSQVAQQYRCRFYPDYRQMLDREELDGISVCTPTSLHYDVSMDIIRRETSVLIEKPICDDLNQAEQLVEQAKAKRVNLLVGHVERYNPAVEKLKEIIDDGVLGELITIQASRLGLSPPRINDADVLVDLAIHDIDICNYLFDGLPDRTHFNCGRAILENRADHVEAMLHYGEKVATIVANWVTPVKVRTLRVTGTNGSAELDYINQRLEVYKLDLHRTFSDYEDFMYKFGEIKKETIEVQKEEPLKRELGSFKKAVADGRCRVDEFALHALKIAMTSPSDR